MAERAEIVARLRQLPEVLGMTVGEIAALAGVTPQMWSNYISETYTENTIRPLAALRLEEATGVPMNWVYGGHLYGCPDPRLRAKLSIANKKAELWLGSRNRPKGNRARIAVIMALGACLVGGFPDLSHAWKRADGLPIERDRAWASHLYCAAKVLRTTLLAKEGVDPEVQSVLYTGCMANRGFIMDVRHPVYSQN